MSKAGDVGKGIGKDTGRGRSREGSRCWIMGSGWGLIWSTDKGAGKSKLKAKLRHDRGLHEPKARPSLGTSRDRAPPPGRPSELKASRASGRGGRHGGRGKDRHKNRGRKRPG